MRSPPKSTRILLAHRSHPTDCEQLALDLVPVGDTWQHRFEPVGVSIVRLGPRGTVVLHTWPERGVITLDGYGAASDDLPARVRALGWRILRTIEPLE